MRWAGRPNCWIIWIAHGPRVALAICVSTAIRSVIVRHSSLTTCAEWAIWDGLMPVGNGVATVFVMSVLTSLAVHQCIVMARLLVMGMLPGRTVYLVLVVAIIVVMSVLAECTVNSAGCVATERIM